MVVFVAVVETARFPPESSVKLIGGDGVPSSFITRSKLNDGDDGDDGDDGES